MRIMYSRSLITFTLFTHFSFCASPREQLMDDLTAPVQKGYLYAPWRNLPIQKPESNGQQKERPCPFCRMLNDSAERDPENLILARNDQWLIALNLFPYSALGHLLIIPKKHAPSINDLTASERAALMELINESLEILKIAIEPDGFNYGVNEGAFAGASIPGHAHFHIVPRSTRFERSFIQIIGGTEVFSWDLNKLYSYLKPYFDERFINNTN